jgi:hypothetical protein
VGAGINNVLAATQKDVMGVITLEVVEEDGVYEIPVVARQVTVGMGGAQVLGCGMLVVVVADLLRELERLLADAAIFNLPMLIFFPFARG